MKYEEFIDKWAARATPDIYGSVRKENAAKKKIRAELKKDLDKFLRYRAYIAWKRAKAQEETPQPGMTTPQFPPIRGPYHDRGHGSDASVARGNSET